MALVSIRNVRVLNNPASFKDPFQFEIEFECFEELEDDLEWRLVYVGSSESTSYDQLLDTVFVGPVPVGINRFVFQTDAPNGEKIPETELCGVTVVLLSCCYKGSEFVRVGYYVNNEYVDETTPVAAGGANGEPAEVDPLAWKKGGLEKVRRNILADQPRVTEFTIQWDNAQTGLEYPPEDVVEEGMDEELSSEDLVDEELEEDLEDDEEEDLEDMDD